MNAVREVVSYETHSKVCAERDAFKDLVEQLAIRLALSHFGFIPDGGKKEVVVGEYTFSVYSDRNGLHAEVKQ